MPKKKIAPYAIFVNEYIERERKKGNFLNFQTASNHVSKQWDNLPASEKDRYKKLSKGNNFSSVHSERLACTGVTVSSVLRQQQEERDKNNDLINHIQSMIDVPKDDLLKTDFFIMHLNYYYKSAFECYPAELAICRFNLKDGLKNYFHIIINPGELPQGTLFEVKDHSSKTHGIPLDYTKGCSNYDSVVNSIIAYAKIEPGSEYVFFTGRDNLLCNHNFTAANLFIDQNFGHYATIKLYPLNEFFYRLRNQFAEIPLPSASLAQEYIKSAEHTVRGISCSLHFDMDCIEHCSLTIATTWVYFLCDYCLPPDFERVVGKHVPPKMGDRIAKKSSQMYYSVRLPDEYDPRPKQSDNVPVPYLSRGELPSRQPARSLSGSSNLVNNLTEEIGDVNLARTSIGRGQAINKPRGKGRATSRPR